MYVGHNAAGTPFAFIAARKAKAVIQRKSGLARNMYHHCVVNVPVKHTLTLQIETLQLHTKITFCLFIYFTFMTIYNVLGYL